MCGINAILLKKGRASKEMLKKMNKKLEHRGRDDEGYFITKDEKAGFAHQRLSILDLTKAGKQPMLDKSGKYLIVYNGEVYNFKEIRKELEREGVKFRSNSDTEVLLELYKKKGNKMLDELRGMFAFVIYDIEKKEAFIARDRFGQKPLCYYENEEGVFISSEIPALLETGLKKEINEEALGYYFLHNFYTIPEPLTIFKGVYRLEPATYMIVKEGKIIEKRRYWKPRFAKKDYNGNEIERFKKLLKESVELRKISDVEISILLSGGVDSSSVVALLGEQIKSYAFGNDEEDVELKRARIVAKKFKTKHKEIIIKEKQLQELKNIIEKFGQPIYVLPITYNAEIAKNIRKEGIKVALTGNGGDELLFGYNGSNRLMFLSYLFFITDRIPSAIFRFFKKFFKGDLRILFSMMESRGEKKGQIYREKAKELLPELFEKEFYEKLKNIDFGRLIDETSKECDSPFYIEKAYWTGIMLENAHSVTIAGDLPFMAYNVESRAPFLDHKLAEYIFSLHPKWKVKSIFDKSKNKYILKKAMEGILPEEILYAKKMGFGYNVKPADKIRGEWRKEIEDKVLRGAYLKERVFNKEFVNKIFEEHMKGKNNTKIIMALYALSIWYEKFMRD